MRFRILFFMASAFVMPFVVQAEMPFFGPIVPDAYNSCAAGWGLLVTVISNVINFILSVILVFVAPLSIVYAGFLFVVNPLDPSGISKAKAILLHTVVGVIVALSGWIVVDTLMYMLVSNNASFGTSWRQLITSSGSPCLTFSTTSTQPSGGPSARVAVTQPSSGSEQSIRERLTQAGITVNHDSCQNGSDGSMCTSVVGMQTATIDHIIAIRNSCTTCQITVTGGTEPGHAESGVRIHSGGYKVDLGLNDTLNAWIIRSTNTAGSRSNGDQVYRDRCGNEYARESNHWDITVSASCNI